MGKFSGRRLRFLTYPLTKNYRTENRLFIFIFIKLKVRKLVSAIPSLPIPFYKKEFHHFCSSAL